MTNCAHLHGKSKDGAHGGIAQGHEEKKEFPVTRVVYIRGIPDRFVDADLEKILSKYGTVEKLLYKREKKHAFVQYASKEEAETLLK